MRDFTTDSLNSLLSAFARAEYEFQSLVAFLQAPAARVVILRHDVDRLPQNALKTADLERKIGITGTYFFRITPESFDVPVVKQIAEMGHEIGYHYEDMVLAENRIKGKGKQRIETGSSEERELAETAIVSFTENLERIRRIAPVKTVCMHGSPMSRWDSRLLWKYYDYKVFGIVAEPYFDLNLDQMLYLTDTGRRWNGDSVSLRDRVYQRSQGYYDQWKVAPLVGSALSMTPDGLDLRRRHTYRSSVEIMGAASEGLLPPQLILTLHPQRWSDSYYGWGKELVFQNLRNSAKYLYIRHLKG